MPEKQAFPPTDGVAEVGDVLVASPLSVVGPARVRWKRNGVDIPGAVGRNYTPTASDLGTEIRASLTFLDGRGNQEVRESNPTFTVKNYATDWPFAEYASQYPGQLPGPWRNVSRTGLGTRVNAQGLIELGMGWSTTDLLGGAGSFASATGWVGWGTGATITGGLLVFNASSWSGQRFGGSYLLSGQRHRVTLTVVRTSGDLLVYGNEGTSVTISTSGTHTIEIVAGSTANGLSIGASSFVGTVDNVTVNGISLAPRITHDPVTLSALGLLVEGQGTNLYPVSDTPSTRTVTVTAAAHTLSVYGTCTITLSGAATGTLTATGAANIRTTLTFTPSAGSLTMTVSGLTTGNRAQLEVGSVATSYIPNPGTGSAVRVADWTGPGVALTGAALAAAFPGGVTQPFTQVIRYRKGYSVAANETLFALSAGSTAGGTNLLALRTNGTQAQLVHSGGAGSLTGTLVHDGSTVNRIAVSVNPAALGPNLVTNGSFASDSGWGFGTGWSTSPGLASKTTSASNGVLQRSSQSLVAGRRYLISVRFLAVRTAAELAVFNGGGYVTIAASPTVGTMTLGFTQESNSTLFLRAAAAADFDITDVSIQEVGAMSISVNGAAAVETTGIAYTGSGVAALIPGSQTYGGTEPMGAAVIAAWDNTRSAYITGAALQALTA